MFEFFLIGYVINFFMYQFTRRTGGASGEDAMGNFCLAMTGLVPFSLPFLALLGLVFMAIDWVADRTWRKHG